MARPQSDLTKYILSLPTTLGPKAVVAKAKEKGYVTSEKNVHRVRSAKRKSGAAPAAAKKASPPKAARKSAPKATAKRGAKGGVNKSAFVRGLATSMSAKDVVDKAKAAGITLSEKYVYNVRASHRTRGASAPKRGPGRPPKATSTVVVRHTGAQGAEHTFVSACLDLGLTRAGELLALLRDKVRAV